MWGTFALGKFRGITLRIHASFLLILPLLAYLFGRSFRPLAVMAGVPVERLVGAPWAWGLGMALALFASVLLHELAHALYAQSKGGRVEDITLLMIGGVSRVVELPKRSKHEAGMALAGPSLSLVLGGVLLAVAYLLARVESFNLSFGAYYLGQLNLFLGAFNLLPAFPMDGGRVLRAALVGRWGRVRATRFAGGLGKAFALLFALVGLAVFNVLLMVIALFVYVGAEAEMRQVLMEAALGKVRVRELMSPRISRVRLDTPLDEVASKMRTERRLGLPVVDALGAVAGVITAAAIKRINVEERSRLFASSAMVPAESLSPDEEVWGALRKMVELKLPQLPVVEEGQLVGTLTEAEVLRGLELGELAAPALPPRAFEA